jgi:hypothetical protein
MGCTLNIKSQDCQTIVYLLKVECSVAEIDFEWVYLGHVNE